MTSFKDDPLWLVILQFFVKILPTVFYWLPNQGNLSKEQDLPWIAFFHEFTLAIRNLWQKLSKYCCIFFIAIFIAVFENVVCDEGLEDWKRRSIFEKECEKVKNKVGITTKSIQNFVRWNFFNFDQAWVHETYDKMSTATRVQFHQRSTRSFCAGRLTPVKYKPKM